jgi:hypothetical protein
MKKLLVVGLLIMGTIAHGIEKYPHLNEMLPKQSLLRMTCNDARKSLLLGLWGKYPEEEACDILENTAKKVAQFDKDVMHTIKFEHVKILEKNLADGFLEHNYRELVNQVLDTATDEVQQEEFKLYNCLLEAKILAARINARQAHLNARQAHLKFRKNS